MIISMLQPAQTSPFNGVFSLKMQIYSELNFREKIKADLSFLSLFADIDDDFIEALEDRELVPPQERESL